MQTFYQDGWMSGETVLADGTSLGWNISDLVRERVITRTNARGKTKSKTKHKVRRTIEMRVAVRHSSYAVGEKAVMAGDGGSVAVKQGEKRATLKVRRVLRSTVVDVSPQVGEFMDTLAAAYTRITIAPQEGK